MIAHDAVQTNPPDHEGFRWTSLDGLVAEADVVTLHCPLFADNTGMINRERLARMMR